MTKEKKESGRLELVRSHISRGSYDRQDLSETPAGAGITSQALHILWDRYDLDNSEKDSTKNPRSDPKLDKIRQKIDDGYYDDPNHLAELAEKLIRKLELE